MLHQEHTLEQSSISQSCTPDPLPKNELDSAPDFKKWQSHENDMPWGPEEGREGLSEGWGERTWLREKGRRMTDTELPHITYPFLLILTTAT
jgi:hypothetical protein